MIGIIMSKKEYVDLYTYLKYVYELLSDRSILERKRQEIIQLVMVRRIYSKQMHYQSR